VVAPFDAQTPLSVRSGLIHHWIGAVHFPNAKLNDVVKTVRDYAQYKMRYHPSVASSRLLETSESKDQFSIVLVNRSLMLKTAYEADCEASYVR